MARFFPNTRAALGRMKTAIREHGQIMREERALKLVMMAQELDPNVLSPIIAAVIQQANDEHYRAVSDEYGVISVSVSVPRARG